MNEKPTRKKNRLDGHDYSQAGAYFVTICVKDRHELLGEIVGDGQVHPVQSKLSDIGRLVEREINRVQSIRKECSVDTFVIMPNHIHLIVRITVVDVGDDCHRPEDTRNTQIASRADCHPPLRKSLPNMVQGLKGAVTRQLGFSIWQRAYHDHIIRSQNDYARIAEYIDNNPACWTEDMYYIKH